MTDRGGRCAQHRATLDRELKAKPEVQARRAIYASRRWRTLRRAVLTEQPWCQHPGCTNLATDADHIIPLRDDGAPFDRTNVQALCARHHSAKTAREVYGRK